MNGDLTPAERGVGLALYRMGGGTDELEANYMLDTDPLAQRIAREMTPAVARAVQAVTTVLTSSRSTPTAETPTTEVPSA